MTALDSVTPAATGRERLQDDARILWQMMRGLGSNGRNDAASHAERLQRFYGPQATRYDVFRERLLHGREELIERLALPPGSTVVDLGGGTGRNLDFFGPRLLSLARVEIVDICPALLDQARLRCARWPEIAFAVEADATTYRPKLLTRQGPGSDRVDCVIFSYSLSMMPDWRRALNNALRILRPGGLIGVVDFHISRPSPPPGFVRHGAFSRRFWPRWFGHDGVRLDPEHLHTLADRTRPVFRAERDSTVPYLSAVSGLRAHYYLYVGRKIGARTSA